jgi:hypothetical protein
MLRRIREPPRVIRTTGSGAARTHEEAPARRASIPTRGWGKCGLLHDHRRNEENDRGHDAIRDRLAALMGTARHRRNEKTIAVTMRSQITLPR